MVNVGALLRQRRLAHGVSQRELAVRAATKQATISRLENGHEIPTADRLDRLLWALGERLELKVVPIDPERPVGDIRADQERRMSERLADGLALAAFAADLAGSART